MLHVYNVQDDGGDHCLVLKCKKNGSWTYSSLTAADGSPCGNGGNTVSLLLFSLIYLMQCLMKNMEGI